MRLRTFTAKTLQAAMNEVRREMGADAVIISTSDGPDGGVEVRAAAERASVAPSAETTEVVRQRRASERMQERGDHAAGITRIARALAWHGIPERAAEALMDGALTLEDGEATATLARSIDARYAIHPIETIPERAILFTGGPGVGKSSTLAKVAARCAAGGVKPVLIGADEGAGAGEQLAAYAAALDCPIHTIAGPRELSTLMESLPEGPVLIDAPAVNPYDIDALYDMSELAAAADGELIAVVDGGCSPGDAEDTGALFVSAGASRAVITKLDISRRLGGLIGAGEAGLAYANISASPFIAAGLAPASALRIARALLDEFAIDWYEDLPQ